jgi:hypothetical protein
MPKKPVSVTLEADNLLWLRGRVSTGGNRSLSDALDSLVTAARTGGSGAVAARSVVGTLDIASQDLALEEADGELRNIFEASLARPFLVREESPAAKSAPRRHTKPARRG